MPEKIEIEYLFDKRLRQRHIPLTLPDSNTKIGKAAEIARTVQY